MLAMVLMEPRPGIDNGAANPTCGSREELVILNLTDKSINALTTGDAAESLGSLAWSPTSNQLAFQVARNCGARPSKSSRCPIPSSLGTHVYDVGSPRRAVEQIPTVLPTAPSPQSETSYGPAFWWKGQLATFFDGKLLGLDGNGGTTGVLATGFPAKVLAVSSDRTGDHLLVSTTPLESDDALRDGTHHIRVTAQLYRWDRGLLTPVRSPPANGEVPASPWIQPAW
jgi:hypothetical protein